MFNAFRQEDPDLEEAIASAYGDLRGYDADSDEYKKIVEQIVKLNSLKNEGLNPNTVATVIGNFAIGLAVLKYERTGVVTSKIWSFMKKI
jgi:hypothetical protein